MTKPPPWKYTSTGRAPSSSGLVGIVHARQQLFGGAGNEHVRDATHRLGQWLEQVFGALGGVVSRQFLDGIFERRGIAGRQRRHHFDGWRTERGVLIKNRLKLGIERHRGTEEKWGRRWAKNDLRSCLS